MLTDDVVRVLESDGLIAVVTVDDADDAVPMSKALIAGGIRVMELTLRTPSAIESLRRIRQEVPEMVAGVGTILTQQQCAEAKEAGGVFGVAPGLNPDVVEEASRLGFPFAPGIATASDIERAVVLDCNVLKFFPSESLGGLRHLQALNSPYAHLSLRFIPLGGIDHTNFLDYLNAEEVLAVGGSWIADRLLVREKRWKQISRNAESARKRAENDGRRR